MLDARRWRRRRRSSDLLLTRAESIAAIELFGLDHTIGSELTTTLRGDASHACGHLEQNVEFDLRSFRIGCDHSHRGLGEIYSPLCRGQLQLDDIRGR